MFFLLQTFIKGENIFNYNLQRVYGIGKNTSKKTLQINGLIQTIKSKYLRKSIKENLKVTLKDSYSPLGRRLKQQHKKDYSAVLELQSYKALRHKSGYPVRGQRTRTNAHTQKVLEKKKNLALQPIPRKKNTNFKFKKGQYKNTKAKNKLKQTQKKK
jgi:small subunit ribosomal protein S13